jgi:hypothetical protein
MLDIGKLQEIINAKKLLEDEGYQSPRLIPTIDMLDNKNSRFMELVDTLATEITDMNFGLDTYVDGTLELTNEAKEYYNEKYDEIEILINNYLKY